MSLDYLEALTRLIGIQYREEPDLLEYSAEILEEENFPLDEDVFPDKKKLDSFSLDEDVKTTLFNALLEEYRKKNGPSQTVLALLKGDPPLDLKEPCSCEEIKTVRAALDKGVCAEGGIPEKTFRAASEFVYFNEMRLIRQMSELTLAKIARCSEELGERVKAVEDEVGSLLMAVRRRKNEKEEEKPVKKKRDRKKFV